MNLTSGFLYGLIVLCAFSCGSSVVASKAPGFDKFPVERTLEETNCFKVNNLSADGLHLYADSLLLVRSAANTSPYHFSLFNMSTKKFLGFQLEAGRKPGQVMSFMSYGISDGNLWTYDIIKDQLHFSNIDSAMPGHNQPTKDMTVPTFYYSVQLLNDSMLVGSGDYDSDYKIAVVDLSSGKVVKQMAPYAKDPSRKLTRSQKAAYESFLFLKPSKEKCVLACRYADQIEIVDLDSQQSKIIKGPENYEPAVMTMKGNDGKELSTRNSDTRYAFVKGKVTDRYIYLLYSGNNHESEHLFYGQYIYVYDWNGHPVQKLKLQDYVLDFAVTKDDALVYTYNPASKYVKVAKLTE